MKTLVAILSSVIMFILSWFLSSLALIIALPFLRQEVSIGSFTTNIASFIGLLIAALVARQTYRASLKAKTGKLYKRRKDEEK